MADVGESKSAFGIPLLIGAIGFGLAAAVLSYIYLKSEEAALIEKYAGREGRPVTVLVAAQNLRKGAILRREVLSQRKIPGDYAHSDAIPARDFEQYIGRTIEVDLAAGKPLLKSFLDDGFPVDFSDTIPVGRRALTVQVDDVNSVAGFIRPGNHIDLFVNIPSGFSGFSAGFITADLVDQIPAELRNAIPPALLDAAGAASTDDSDIQQLVANALPKDVILPVLQNVRVLATGRDPYREQLDALRYPQPRAERTFSSVTLDVSPRDAALITAALDKGELLAILRNRDDDSKADFSTLSAQDLFSNAFAMAEAASAQRARVASAAGVDERGNLVDADGKTLMNREQLEAAGLTVNDKGELVDKDGNVVDPNDLLVTADGRVVSKKDLEGSGFSVNASGQIVDANGNIVDADDLVVGADGRVLTKQQLAAAGLSVNENGEIVDSSGRVVDPAELVTTADGRILSSESLAAAGLSVDADGNLVDANGNIVDPDSLVVSANGDVLNTEQLAAAGLRVNERGEIVDASGKVVDPNTIVTDVNGKIIDQKLLAAAGLSVNERGEIVDRDGRVIDPNSLELTAEGQLVTGESKKIDLIIGGASTDGVAKSTSLKATE